MRLSRYTSLAASVALVQAQGSCRFGNGTLLPDTSEWNIYQPCPGDDGPGTICCALNRSQPPWGNFSLGATRDDCLPNGLCQNRITTNEGARVTTFFIDYCTENGQDGSEGKCINVCPFASQELTAKITPCDGTANSTEWCCGADTACCKSRSGVVKLDQVLGQVSSSTSIQSSTATSSASTASGTAIGSTTSQASASASAGSAGTNESNASTSSSSKGLSGGAIAGIVIGAIAGIALIAAALFFARRASQKKRAANMGNVGNVGIMTSQPVAEMPYSPGAQELPPTVKYAHVAEAPGSPPSELHGDVPTHR
ncbi:hypothetical protein B5807_04620 [Epicoccum nigrum]|uniref:Mid2 domain-containing protein n=1 Tax=Epicoccum nigrum TaxID=105696 RepID=A0A1Y2M4N0_EPING|nr:hypothetical protein B5807_04620 [Epicoccum nigrum]